MEEVEESESVGSDAESIEEEEDDDFEYNLDVSFAIFFFLRSPFMRLHLLTRFMSRHRSLRKVFLLLPRVGLSTTMTGVIRMKSK